MSRSVGSLLLYRHARCDLFLFDDLLATPRHTCCGGEFFWGEAAVCLLKGTRDNAQRQDECDDEFAFTIHPNGWNS